MNTHNEERIKQLLKNAFPPVGDAEPERALWPDMLRRLDAQRPAVPWFDWALAAGLAVFIGAFPASIPVFLYYL